MAQVAIPLAATAFSVAGKVQQGRAAKKAGDAEAAQLEENARLARQEGKTRAEEEQRQTARLMSDISAAQGGSGFAASDAQAARQVARAAGAGKYNELSILYQSETEARGLERGARTAKKQGRYARNAAYMSAAGTAIGGAYRIGKDQGWFKPKPIVPVSTSQPSAFKAWGANSFAAGGYKPIARRPY